MNHSVMHGHPCRVEADHYEAAGIPTGQLLLCDDIASIQKADWKHSSGELNFEGETTLPSRRLSSPLGDRSRRAPLCGDTPQRPDIHRIQSPRHRYAPDLRCRRRPWCMPVSGGHQPQRQTHPMERGRLAPPLRSVARLPTIESYLVPVQTKQSKCQQSVARGLTNPGAESHHGGVATPRTRRGTPHRHDVGQKRSRSRSREKGWIQSQDRRLVKREHNAIVGTMSLN